MEGDISLKKINEINEVNIEALRVKDENVNSIIEGPIKIVICKKSVDNKVKYSSLKIWSVSNMLWMPQAVNGKGYLFIYST